MIVNVYVFTRSVDRIHPVTRQVKPDPRPLAWHSFEPVADAEEWDEVNCLHTLVTGGESPAFRVAAPGAEWVERPPIVRTYPDGSTEEIPRGRAIRNHWGEFTADCVATLARMQSKGFALHPPGPASAEMARRESPGATARPDGFGTPEPRITVVRGPAPVEPPAPTTQAALWGEFEPEPEPARKSRRPGADAAASGERILSPVGRGGGA